MKGRLTLLGRLPHGGSAAARLEDGRLEDLLLDPAPDDSAPRPGAIHRAVLGRPMKGLGGAFVELGGGRTGFLRETRGLAPGRPVLVEVAGWAEPQKAPPVTRRLLLKGRLAILTPRAPGLNLARTIPAGARDRLADLAAAAMSGADGGLGLILRSAAADADPAQVAAEIAELRAEWQALEAAAGASEPACLRPAASADDTARRDWPAPGPGGLRDDPAAFEDHGVWDAIAALLRPDVPLPGGASLAVEATRALVAVDVNTGGDASPAAALKANLAAARELPRQLRLRGLGGQVVIDPAPLARRDRPRMLDALKAALARDPVETTVLGFSALGLLEATRRRDRRPLAELAPREHAPSPTRG